MEVGGVAMTAPALIDTARRMVGTGKGLLAMDESNPTCNKRFAALGIPQTVEARRSWRELIITTPELADSIGGAILYDETIHQSCADGTPFVKVLSDAGIVVGIKVDTGAKALAGHAGEKVTEGLDGLRERLEAYAAIGARFAKWRAVIAIGADLPSAACIEANAHALARYAALCQEAGLVPIVGCKIPMQTRSMRPPMPPCVACCARCRQRWPGLRFCRVANLPTRRPRACGPCTSGTRRRASTAPGR